MENPSEQILNPSAAHSIRLVKSQLKVIREFGVEIAHFPKYVNLSYEPHELDVVLLSYVVHGRGVHRMGEESYILKPGCLGITSYGQEHDLITTPQGIEQYNIFLDMENFSLPRLESPLQQALSTILPLRRSLCDKKQRRVQLEFEEPRELTFIIQSFHRELNERRPGQAFLVRNHLAMLLGLICRNALEHGIYSPETDQDTPSHRIEKLRQFLDKNFALHHALDNLAHQSGFSRNYLCRIFRLQTGKTISQYIAFRRIHAAMLALQTTNDKIIAIAMDSGFDSVSHFNRQFNRLTGISPSEYRATKRDCKKAQNLSHRSD